VKFAGGRRTQASRVDRPAPARERWRVRTTSRAAATLCSGVALATGLAACGAAGSTRVVARVGGVPITLAQLNARTIAMAHEVSSQKAPRQLALSLLISSLWLIGEAAAQGKAVSHEEVMQQFTERSRAFPKGSQEFREYLKVTGQSVPDMMHSIEAELAAVKLDGLRERKVLAVSQEGVAEYYRQNMQRFVFGDERDVEVVNSTSEAAIRTIRTKAKAGRSFASMLEQPGLASRAQLESLVYTVKETGAAESVLEKAIFSARRDVIVGPIRVGANYFVFKVTRITPPSRETLAEAQSTIRTRLMAEYHEQAIVSFVKALSEKWTAKTNCAAGYVVQKCRQYSGHRVAEEDPLDRPGAPRGATD
jgi:hypothetical protein